MADNMVEASAQAQAAEIKQEQSAAEKIILLVALLGGVAFLLFFRSTISVEAVTSVSKLVVELGGPVILGLIAVWGKTRRALAAFLWPLLSSAVKLKIVRQILNYLLIFAFIILFFAAGALINVIMPS